MLKNKNTEFINSIFYNLEKKGYILTGVVIKKSKIMPIEKLIISILADCKEPRLTEGIPVIIKKSHIDYGSLITMAIQNKVTNDLHYVLTNTNKLFMQHHKEYAQKKELKQAIAKLYPYIDKKPHIMINVDLPGLENTLKQLQLPEEKRSRTLGRITYNSFEHAYNYKNYA